MIEIGLIFMGLSLGFGSVLMQTNVSDPVASLAGLIAAVGGLVATGSGIAIAYLNKKANQQGGVLTEQQKQLLEAAKFLQLTAKKAVEERGQISDIAQGFYDSLTEEQKLIAHTKVKPVMDTVAEQAVTYTEQAEKIAKLFGVNVDDDPNIPRESTETLTKVNASVRKLKSGETLR